MGVTWNSTLHRDPAKKLRGKPGKQLRRRGWIKRVSGKRASAPPQRRSRPETGFPRPVKLAVRERAGGGDIDQARCEATGAWLGRYGGEIQHRDARGMGGTSDPVTNSIVNAVLLSTEAHRLAESRDRAMNEEGFWLRNGQDPALTPVLLHSGHGSGVMVWLTLEGGYSEQPPGSRAA